MDHLLLASTMPPSIGSSTQIDERGLPFCFCVSPASRLFGFHGHGSRWTSTLCIYLWKHLSTVYHMYSDAVVLRKLIGTFIIMRVFLYELLPLGFTVPTSIVL